MRVLQPFDPDDIPGRKKLLQLREQVPLRAVLPSLVTLLALCAGLSSIRMAIEERFDFAAAFIIVAAALDGIDGRVARFLKSSSRFGAELDSIADFLNFGVAPVVMLYIWTLSDMKSVGWMAVLVFGICTSLRLARFNVAIGAPDKPDWHGNFFVGVPAPAGALVVLMPFYVEQIGIPRSVATAPITFAFTLVVGLLLVSRIPTWSGKLAGNQIKRDWVVPLFVAGVVLMASLASFPWFTMLALTLAYLVSLPFSLRAFQRRTAAEQAAASSADKPQDAASADDGEGGGSI